MDDTQPALTNESVVSTKKPTTFFSLPTEIRTMIYQLHLPPTTSITLCSHSKTTKSDLGVNLLRSCRQIYLEASQYAYAERLFRTNRSCRSCYQHLTLADSNFLTHLQNSAIHRIERLELAVHADCLASYRASRSSYRAVKASTHPHVRLSHIREMHSLRYICVKVVLFKFVCCVPAHAIKWSSSRLCDLGFDVLMIKIYDMIPKGIQVEWEAELSGENLPLRELEKTKDAATECVRNLAERYQHLQARRVHYFKPEQRKVAKLGS